MPVLSAQNRCDLTLKSHLWQNRCPQNITDGFLGSSEHNRQRYFALRLDSGAGAAYCGGGAIAALVLVGCLLRTDDDVCCDEGARLDARVLEFEVSMSKGREW